MRFRNPPPSACSWVPVCWAFPCVIGLVANKLDEFKPKTNSNKNSKPNKQMKLNKSLLAVALGLSVAGVSQAGEVYLTGSTAMRSTIYTVLNTPNVVFSGTPVFTGYGGKGSGDNYMAFYGTLKGGSGS